MRALLLALLVSLCGCGSYFTEMGHNVAAGAVEGTTTDDARKRISQLTSDAVKAGRDQALGPETQAEVQALTKTITDEVRAQLVLVIQELRPQLLAMVREMVDAALGPATVAQAAAIRETLVGPALQKDVDALIDAEVPRLTQALQQSIQITVKPIEQDVTKEAAEWKPVAMWVAVGAALLVVALVLGLLLQARSHRKTVEALTAIIRTRHE